MEASGASGTAADPTAGIEAAVSQAEQAVTALKDRVTGDLQSLRDEIAQLHADQQAGATVDLAPFVERITTLTTTLEQIDVAQVVAVSPGGDATATSGVPADSSSAAAPADASGGGAMTGDQGQQVAPPAGAPTDAPTGAPTGAPTRTLYTFSGDTSQIDASSWPPADVQTADGRPLYTFAADTAPGDARGAGLQDSNGTWQVYDGPTQPVTPA